MLIDAGLSLPEGVLLDDGFRGMSAEQIYNLLETKSEQEQDPGNEEEENGTGDEGPSNDPSPQSDSEEPSAPETEGGIGQVLDAPFPDEETPSIEEQAREWNVAVNQAMTVAQQAGKVPAGLDRTLEGAAEATVNWRELLRRLWSETTPSDYRCDCGPTMPAPLDGTLSSRRGARGHRRGRAIAVDCSGSVNARQLRLFEAEARSILEGQRPERVYVLYFDAAVHKVDTYEAGQRIDLNPVGGGGTEFGPCFEWLDERGIRPQSLVFLTDLYGSFPQSAPSYPVLWASTGSQKAPFGEVIPMQAA